MARFRISALSAERPFTGLRPFAAEDHEFFCGRDAQIYGLYRLVDISRFVAVVGSSGSGKSSLVRAGLFPLVDEENAEGGKRKWLRVEMRPGNAPLAELTRALTELSRTICANDPPKVAAARQDRIAHRIGASSQGIIDALGEIDGIGGRSLVLTIDQFEELFRYSSAPPDLQSNRAQVMRSRDEAAHFAQLLLAASRRDAIDVHVVVTMRSDFIGDCARFQGLPEAVSATQFLVPSLTRAQREQVIRKPLERASSTIETELVDRLLTDAPDELDQLPVLQHCLFRLWEKAGAARDAQGGAPDGRGANTRHLTVEHYREIGGIQQALSNHANEILGRIASLEPVVARVFRALSEFDNDHRAVRRARSFLQLAEETGAENDDLRKVLDQFRADDCSFLTTSPPGVDFIEDSTGIDISHEALLRRWDRVAGHPEATGAPKDTRPVGWMREEEEDGRHYQALLYHDVLWPFQLKRTLAWWTKLPRTAAWAARYGGGFEHVKKLLRRSQNVARISLAAIGALCLLLAAFAGLAIFEGHVARRNYEVAQENLKTVLRMGDQVYSSTLENLNRGDISSAAAQTLAAAANDSIKKVLSDHKQNPEVLALAAKQLLTVSDVYIMAGNNEEAYKDAQSAETLAQQLLHAEAGNSDCQLLEYRALFRIADVLVAPGRHLNVKNGLTIYLTAQRIAEQLAKRRADDGERLYDLAFIDNKIGETYQQLNELNGLNDLTKAVAHFDAALRIAERIAAMPSAKIHWQAYPAATLTKIGRALVASGQIDQGIGKYDEAIALQEGILNATADRNNDIVSSNLLTARRLKGAALVQEAKADPPKYALAFAEYDKALKIAGELLDKDSGNAIWLVAAAVAHDFYAKAKEEAGDRAGALQQYQQELPIRQKLLIKDKSNEVWQRGLRRTQAKVAQLQAQLPIETPIAPSPGSKSGGAGNP